MIPFWIKQWGLFFILWSSYAATYFLRKPISVLKPAIKENLHLSTSQLGWLDVSLLLPYAVVSLMFGNYVDKYGPKKALSWSLVLAAAATFPMGQCESIWSLLPLIMLSGVAQPLCWPACCKIIIMWFSKENLNTVFGMFGSSLFGGGLLGAAFAVCIQELYGWRNVFPACALVAATFGVIVMLFVTKPNGDPNASATDDNEALEDNRGKATGGHPQYTVKELVLLPLVAETSFSQFCVKIVRYSLMLWLPLFLFQSFGYSEGMAGLLSTTFEIGGLFGSSLLGLFIDKFMNERVALACSVSMFLAATFVFLSVSLAQFSTTILLINLTLVGLFTGGPANIITSGLSKQVGDKYGATSAVIGIVNGFAVLGTVLEGPTVAFTVDWFGWNFTFALLVLLCLLGGLTSMRIHRVQTREGMFTQLM